MKGLISYALAIGGLTMIAAAVIATFVGNIKYVYARALVMNLLRTNPRKAAELCARPNNSFMDAIGAALKTCAATKSNDPKVIVQASVPSYDAAGTMVVMRFDKLIMKGKLGAMAVAGGFVLGVFGGKFSVILLILTIVAAGGVLWLVLRKIDAEQMIARARAEVLPEVDRVFVDGRFV